MYKTKKCRFFNGICNKEEYCPFYHKTENKRVINETLDELLSIKRTKLKELNKIETLFGDSQVENKSQANTRKYHSIHASPAMIVKSTLQETNRSLNNIHHQEFKDSQEEKEIINIKKSKFSNHVSSGKAPLLKINSINNTTADRSNSIFSNNSLFSEKFKPIVTSNIDSSPPNRKSQKSKNYSPTRKSQKSKNRLSAFKRNSSRKSILESTLNLADQDVSQEIIADIEEIFESSDDSFEKNIEAISNKSTQFDNLPENVQKELNENIYCQDFFRYLKVHKFNLLLKAVVSGELTIHQVLQLSEEKLIEYVEESNINVFQNLVKRILDINDNNEMDSLFKKIDDDIQKNYLEDS